MSLLHYNVRSLLPKLDNLKAECIIFKPDVVCICETWLGRDIDDTELSIDGYRTIRLDRNRHGGGVALFISSNLSHKVIYSGNGSFECIIVSLQFGPCKVCVCLLYRPPNSSCDFLDYLYDVLYSIDISFFSNFLLLGDFNIDFLAQSHPLFSKVVCITSSFLFHQVVSHPTHFSYSGVPSILTLCLYLALPTLFHVARSRPCLPQTTLEFI